MKRTLSWLTAGVVLVAGTAFGMQVDTRTYFPLTPGSHWAYVQQGGLNDKTSVTVLTGQSWSGQTGLTALAMEATCEPTVKACVTRKSDFYRVDAAGIWYYGFDLLFSSGTVGNKTYSEPDPLLKAIVDPAAIGGGYGTVAGVPGGWSAPVSGVQSQTGPFSGYASHRAVEVVTLTVPAGTFKDVLHISNFAYPASALTESWYAPCVGLIQLTAGTMKQSLVSYSVPDCRNEGSVYLPYHTMPSGSAQGMWWNPDQPGWGLTFTHQADLIFMAWYTYGEDGKPYWYVATLAEQADHAFTGDLYETTGPPWTTPAFDPKLVTEKAIGTATLMFSDANHATIQLFAGSKVQASPLTRMQFGVLPTCSYQPGASGTGLTNYTDMWWNPEESGWGLTLTHQGDTAFAAWYVYNSAGKPTWFVSTLARQDAKTYTGTVSETTGPWWATLPWDSKLVTEKTVGIATYAAIDGMRGAFSWTANGASASKQVTRLLFRGLTVCN